MVPIEDSGADTNDAVLRDREQSQHVPQPSTPSPTRFLLQWVTDGGVGIGADVGGYDVANVTYEVFRRCRGRT